MIEVTIRATNKEDAKVLDLFKQVLCYGITDEQDIKLVGTNWDGHSGGDDAYFGLMDKKVSVYVEPYMSPEDQRSADRQAADVIRTGRA